MRFRYFDGEGIEVEISSVDALAFRIRTGIIGEETLLYDSAVDEWGPAGTHPVFRFVKEEGEGPWTPEEIAGPPQKERTDEPPPVAESLEDFGSLPTPEEPRSRKKAKKTKEAKKTKKAKKTKEAKKPGAKAKSKARKKREPTRKTKAETQKSGGASGAKPAPKEAATGGKTTGEKKAPKAARPTEEDAKPEEAPDTGSGLPDLGVTPIGSDPSGAPAPDAPTSAPRPRSEPPSPSAGGAGPPDRPASGGDSPWADLMESPGQGAGGTTGARSSSPPSTATTSLRTGSLARKLPGSSRRRRRRRVRRALRLVVGVLALVAVTVVALFYLGEAGLALVEEARTGAAGLVAEARAREGEAAAPGGGEGAAAPEGDAAEDGGTRAAALAGAGAAPPVATTPRPSAPEPADLPTVDEVTAAVQDDLARSAAELRDALGVPDAPPPEWLHGVYLARASSFPEVEAYWDSFRVYVTSVRAMERDLYRGFVQNRILEMGADPTGAAELSTRALERFEAADTRRQTLYGDLLSLATEAEELHGLLVEREASIAYEPFTTQGLSRDPVVEAVPEDPALAEEIWTRLDGIFDRLDRIQGIRPVSTLRLQEALLGGLELPDRPAGGSPESPEPREGPGAGGSPSPPADGPLPEGSPPPGTL